MDLPRKPPIAPGTGSSRHSPGIQPRLLSQTVETQTLLPAESRAPRSTRDLKRKEHAEPPVGSEENKRHKFRPSEMAIETTWSDAERFDDDIRDEGKGKKWMQSELSRLRAEIENHKRNKQDMLLDFLQEQQRREKAESNLRREQLRSARNLAVWKKELWREELRTAKDDLQAQRMQRQYAEARVKEGLQTIKEGLERELAMSEHAQAAADGLNSEIEHLQEVNATMMSDLDELRGIENEDAAKRRDQHLGLPPAYGNIDDEDCFPPYSAHEDGGTIEVAHLKREIRQQFEFVLNGALNGGVEKSSKLESLGALSCGLNKACDSLQKLLDIAPNVPVSRVRKPVDYGGYIDLQLRSIADSVRGERDRNLNVIERKYPRTVDRLLQVPAHRYLPGYAIVQKENSAPYVADRIAKLLLELLWRSAAVCEVRPGAGALPPNAARSSGLITSIVLQFTQVDSVLTKALQLASSRRISMSELQYHLTQLHLLDNIIQGELDEQDVDRQFFVKSTEWLEKQIEKLRSLSEIEACRLAHPELFGQDEDRDEGDDVSSRWQGSDAGSVEQLLEGELFFRDEEDEDVDLSGDKNKDKDGDNGQ